MAVTKDDWKNVGKEFAGAFKTLGKSVVKSVQTGVDKAEQWVADDDAKKQASAANTEKPAEAEPKA
ncbi:MAG: hypothetical protein ACI4XQ_00345 [Eubacteriales bacterium]